MYTLRPEVADQSRLEDSAPEHYAKPAKREVHVYYCIQCSGVSGLKSPISVRAPYVTIAGQTAPEMVFASPDNLS